MSDKDKQASLFLIVVGMIAVESKNVNALIKYWDSVKHNKMKDWIPFFFDFSKTTDGAPSRTCCKPGCASNLKLKAAYDMLFGAWMKWRSLLEEKFSLLRDEL
jgi:hypothetical protein